VGKGTRRKCQHWRRAKIACYSCCFCCCCCWWKLSIMTW
jgi:hypothetical protein